MHREPFNDLNKIIEFLKLDKKNKKRILHNSSFPFLLPYHLAKKIKKNDLQDPILKQFLPILDEKKEKKNFVCDPLSEKHFRKENLLKKYSNRALLLCTNSCAMNCRFCFRRHNYKNTEIKNFEKEIEIIKNDKSLEEMILSGGDPLSLSNNNLSNLLEKLNSIKHIKRIRFHTRYILGYPKRIDDMFLEILNKLSKQIIFVFHINHPNEIDEDIIACIHKLKGHFLLFNQSVLLKGVNDNLLILKSLNEILIQIGIIPYYLHQLDKVKNASHFEVNLKKGKKLIELLKQNTSGYIYPKYVLDKQKQKSKFLIS